MMTHLELEALAREDLGTMLEHVGHGVLRRDGAVVEYSIVVDGRLPDGRGMEAWYSGNGVGALPPPGITARIDRVTEAEQQAVIAALRRSMPWLPYTFDGTALRLWPLTREALRAVLATFASGRADSAE